MIIDPGQLSKKEQRIHIQGNIYQDGYILLDRYRPIGRLGWAGQGTCTTPIRLR